MKWNETKIEELKPETYLINTTVNKRPFPLLSRPLHDDPLPEGVHLVSPHVVGAVQGVEEARVLEVWVVREERFPEVSAERDI